MSRRSYSGLMAQPAWGLYRDEQLLASVRAPSRDGAWELFVGHWHTLDAAHFVCPRCGRESAHPLDAAEGYCGACHAWTGVALAVRAIAQP